MRTDTTYIYNKVCSAALMMLCCVALFSCTKVDLCEEPQHIHRGDIILTFHWGDVPKGQRPASMFALISRAVTTHHMGYVTGSDTSSVGGYYQFGRMYEDSVTDLMAKVGSYRVFAFNNDIVDTAMNDAGYYRFENFDQFAHNEGDNTIDVNDLYISYVPHELTDTCVFPYSIDSIDNIDWIDTNPYSKYIAANMKPLYRAVNDYDEKAQSYTFSVKEQGETEVHLYPQKATQDITITFPIYLEYTDEDTVSAESIIAEISGIPHRMNFNSGELYVDTTYKVLFKMELDALNAKDTILKVNDALLTFKKMECFSTISVTGLLANEGPEYATGAGIMQLCAHLSTKGVKKAKVMAKVNMYNTINNANLIIKDEEGRIMQNSKEIYPELPYNDTLRVEGNLLTVTLDLVLKTVGGGEGTDTWQGDKDGDGEIDDDHKLDIEH